MQGSKGSARTVMVTGFRTHKDCLFSTVTTSISSPSVQEEKKRRNTPHEKHVQGPYAGALERRWCFPNLDINKLK